MESKSTPSRDPGRGRKGGRPLARHAPHVRGAPGAKPFVDDLLLGRGFVRSRAAPSLRSIESQPSTQGFVARSLSLFPPRGLRLSAGGRRRVLGPGPRSGAGGGPPSSAERAGADVGGEERRGAAPGGASRPRGAAPLPPLPRRGSSPAGWAGGRGERRGADGSPGPSLYCLYLLTRKDHHR